MTARSRNEQPLRRGGLLRGGVLQSQSAATPSDVEHDAHAFQVNLIKSQGVVREIEVTCECGRSLRIACDYTEELPSSGGQRLLKSEK